MSGLVVAGVGAVSPAGWGMGMLSEAMARGTPLETQEMVQPGFDELFPVRRVPAADPCLSHLRHPRLRRSTRISQFVVGAALEALGTEAERVREGLVRLGIVVCTMCGCVSYTRRFYEETLRNPATASPLLFPETVFNAPGSHLAALLESTGWNYTLVGDEGSFLQGLSLVADWLEADMVDGCVVIGAEELDWVVPDAQRHFARDSVLSEGAGAIYLRRGPAARGEVVLRGVTTPHLYVGREPKRLAAERMRRELTGLGSSDLLCDGLQGTVVLDRVEETLWREWRGDRVSPLRVVGGGYVAGAAWQSVVAVGALQSGRYRAASVSVVGSNEQAVGARFEVEDGERSKMT